jgi:hypothetical protein
VTLVAVGALAAAGAQSWVRLEAGFSRRNLKMRGLDLGALIGRSFASGGLRVTDFTGGCLRSGGLVSNTAAGLC